MTVGRKIITVTSRKAERKIEMSKRFYFMNGNDENIANDHIGNIRGARTVAKRLANELGEYVIIIDWKGDVVEFVYPDNVTMVTLTLKPHYKEM